MAGLLHVFTHFKLHIEPWYVECDSSTVAEPGRDRRGFPSRQLPSTALPAPVKKILGGLFELRARSGRPYRNTLLSDWTIAADTHQYAAGRPQGQQRRSAIAHEGQGNAYYRKNAGDHANVHEDINKEHHGH